MKHRIFAFVFFAAGGLLHAQGNPAADQSAVAALSPKQEEIKALNACAQMVIDQLKYLKIPNARDLRFQGKVSDAMALCRGGEQAIEFRGTPWVDWSNYWGTGDMTSLPTMSMTLAPGT